MSDPALSIKLKIAFAVQSVFAIALILYLSQSLFQHLQFGVPRPIADRLFELIAIIVPPVMLLLSFFALRRLRRAIQGSIIAELLVCLAAARFLVPELLDWARGENIGWVGPLLIAGSAPVMLVSLTLAGVFYHQLAVTHRSQQV